MNKNFLKLPSEKACRGFELMVVHTHLIGGFQKVYDFFRTSSAARDVSIGAMAFVIGGYILAEIKKIRQDE